MYLDLEGGLTGSALCLSGPLKRLTYSFSGSLLQRQSTSQGNMNHQKFYMRLVLVSFTINLQLHVHYSRSSEEPKPPVLGTRGPRDRSHDVSVYETCACAIINLLSCI